MKMLKKMITRQIQRLYRSVAAPGLLNFDLSDTPDPLFGAMSGTPVDRALIESAISTFAIRNSARTGSTTGFGLEIGSTDYLKIYFPSLTHFQLDFEEDSGLVISGNIVRGDLQVSQNVVNNEFDVIVSTQVLSFIPDYEAALLNFWRMLKPGGILFGTEPHISPISVFDEHRWGEWNRFTKRSLAKTLSLLSQDFEVNTWGNAYSSAALILGIPSESLNLELITESRESHATVLSYCLRKTS